MLPPPTTTSKQGMHSKSYKERLRILRHQRTTKIIRRKRERAISSESSSSNKEEEGQVSRTTTIMTSSNPFQEEEGGSNNNCILSMALQFPTFDAPATEDLQGLTTTAESFPSSTSTTSAQEVEGDPTSERMGGSSSSLSVLCNLLWKRQWEVAVQLIQQSSSGACYCSKSSTLPCFSNGGCGLPLHLVCSMRPLPPACVVELILKQYPQAASQKASMWGLLPLHLAVDLRKQQQASDQPQQQPPTTSTSLLQNQNQPTTTSSAMEPINRSKSSSVAPTRWSPVEQEHEEEATPSAASLTKTDTGVSMGSQGSSECSEDHTTTNNECGLPPSVGPLPQQQSSSIHHHQALKTTTATTDHCRIVEMLLEVYPQALLAKEEFQGMLPLHIAASSTPTSSSDGKIPPSCAQILQLLLQHAPQTLALKDYAGDTPRMLAKRASSSSSPRRHNHQVTKSSATTSSTQNASASAPGTPNRPQSCGSAAAASANSRKGAPSLPPPDWEWNPILHPSEAAAPEEMLKEAEEEEEEEEEATIAPQTEPVPTSSLLVGSVDELLNMSSYSEGSSSDSSSSSSSSSQSCTSNSSSCSQNEENKEREDDSTIDSNHQLDDGTKVSSSSYDKVLRQELEDSIRVYCPPSRAPPPSSFPPPQPEVAAAATSTTPSSLTTTTLHPSVPIQTTHTDQKIQEEDAASIPEMTHTSYDTAFGVEEEDCSDTCGAATIESKLPSSSKEKRSDQTNTSDSESCCNPTAVAVPPNNFEPTALLAKSEEDSCSTEIEEQQELSNNTAVGEQDTSHNIFLSAASQKEQDRALDIQEQVTSTAATSLDDNSSVPIENENRPVDDRKHPVARQGPSHKCMVDSSNPSKNPPHPVDAETTSVKAVRLLHEDGSSKTQTNVISAREINPGNLSELQHQLKRLQEENKSYSKEVERLKQRVSIMSEVKGVKVDDLKVALQAVCNNETALVKGDHTNNNNVVSSVPDVLSHWRQELCGEVTTTEAPTSLAESSSVSPEVLDSPNLEAVFSEWHDELVKEGTNAVFTYRQQSSRGDGSSSMIAIVPSKHEEDGSIVGLEILIFDDVRNGNVSNTSIYTPQQSATLIVQKGSEPGTDTSRGDLLREILQTTRRKRLREIVSRSTQKQRSFDTGKVVRKIMFPQKRGQNYTLLHDAMACLDEAFDDVWAGASLYGAPLGPSVRVLSTGNYGMFLRSSDIPIVDHNPDSFAEMEARQRRMIVSTPSMDKIVDDLVEEEQAILPAAGSVVEATTIVSPVVDEIRECGENNHCKNPPVSDRPTTQSCVGDSFCNFWASLEATECALACVEKFTEAHQSFFSNHTDSSREGSPPTAAAAAAAAKAASTERDKLVACSTQLKHERELMANNNVSIAMLSQMDSLVDDLDQSVFSLTNHINSIAKWTNKKKEGKRSKAGKPSRNPITFFKKRAAASYATYTNKKSSKPCGIRRSACL